MESTFKQYRKDTLATLKANIKESAERIRLARAEARKLSGLERHYAKQEANDGSQRYRLLAYGFLRNRTYQQIENKANSLPSAYSITRHLPACEGQDFETQIEKWVSAGDVKPKALLQTPSGLAASFQAVA